MSKNRLSVCAFALVVALAASAQTSPVMVTASGQHYGGQVVYSYEVTNKSGEPLKSLAIGLALPSASDGAAQLAVLPRLGPGNSAWLAPEVAARPAGWGAYVMFPEGSDKFAIEWMEANFYFERWPGSPPSANSPGRSATTQFIPSGTTPNQFSVTVGSVDSMYVNGSAAVELGGQRVNVPLVKKDQSPPQISLNVARVNQNEGNGRYAIFDVQASVSDDVDPAPEFSMEPITANAPISADDVVVSKKSNHAWNVRLRNIAGRTYTMTFRALDASGNGSVKTYSYRVDG